ncbi:lytic transglycosylase domain-containing protein [Cryobacterium sp. TMT2-14]|nr:lytic transglycosylase domain-containing protein [Cryobacterium sp. TMT2-14]
MMASKYGWGADQLGCLVSLWNKESGWNVNAYNASSGATGIPQALPGSKMASAGADWATNPATQISWGLNYIAERYGDPCGAWYKSVASGWY